MKTKEIDKTIKKICKKVQKDGMVNGEYADMVKALASLVEARANCNNNFENKKCIQAILGKINLPQSQVDPHSLGRLLRPGQNEQ